MKKTKNEIKEIRKQSKALKQQERQMMKERVLEVINDGDDSLGMTKTEIAKEAFGKTYVSEKDEREIYEVLKLIREESNKLLLCSGTRYRWADSKDEVDSYFMRNVSNGMGKVAKSKALIVQSYKALGIRSDPGKVIAAKLADFGVQQIEYVGGK